MEGDLQRVFGANLRLYRKQRGLSQEAFADVLEFNRTYVGSLECGKRNPSLRSIERIAARIDVEPLALLQPVTEPDGDRKNRARKARH